MIVYFDLLIVVLLAVFLIRKKQLLLLNPTVIYLIIHVSFVTLRGIQIFIFDNIIVSNRVYDTILSTDEILKAIFIADIGLISFFLGFNLFRAKFSRNSMNLRRSYPIIIETKPQLINIYLISIVILGVFGLLMFAYIPGLGKNSYNYSSLTEIMANLAIISAIVLIYQKGFKTVYLLYFVSLVVVYSLQGYARYRAVLPLLFILLYYLKYYKLKLPPVKYIIIGVLVILISIPLKQIGISIRDGNSINLTEVLQNSLTEIVEGESGELALIEQSAAMVGNLDKKEKVFYGETYASIFFFFIPRDWWKEKPALNEWQDEISDSGRRFSEMGQISLVTGEAYANFRIPGVVLIMILLGIFYSYLYFTFSRLDIKHRGFLLLLLFDMLLFQVWRDGLISLFLFPLLNYLPIIVLFFLKKPTKLIVKRNHSIAK
jgi:hypothetical protein